MRITTRVAMEVAHHEAVIRQAYRDSRGTWTWAVGITSESGHPVEQYIDTPQSMQKCLRVWLHVLDDYAEDVRQAFDGVDLTEAQFAAALSFHWNTGAIKRASWVQHFKAGDMRRARKRFMDWRKPPEIIPRRKAECALFFDDTWSGTGYITEYTRLTGNHTPAWSSAVRRDVSRQIHDILNPPVSQPDPQEAPGGLGALLSRLVEFIVRLFGGKKP